MKQFLAPVLVFSILLNLSIPLVSEAAEAQAGPQGIFAIVSVSGGEHCLFKFLDNDETLAMLCGEEGQKLEGKEFAFIRYRREDIGYLLEEIVGTEFVSVTAQANFRNFGGANPEFYFRDEDDYRKMFMREDQYAELMEMQTIPLKVVYLQDAASNFYLASYELYEAEFTEAMEYLGHEREAYAIFFRNELGEKIFLRCTQEQLAALESGGPFFTVTFTDAGGRRLLHFEELPGMDDDYGRYEDVSEPDEDE